MKSSTKKWSFLILMCLLTLAASLGAEEQREAGKLVLNSEWTGREVTLGWVLDTWPAKQAGYAVFRREAGGMILSLLS